MQMATNPGALISTHDSLDEVFALMIRAAHIGDWATCDKVREMFAVALDVHLRHEETVQFPRYEATSKRAAVEVQQFMHEHGRIRRAAGRLLAGLQERRLEFDDVGSLELLLREHDAHESVHFQPWLATFGRC